MCDRIGRLHLCGIHCRSRSTDTVKGGLHTCPLTGIVLQSQLEGPLDNYQRQIVGGDGDDDDTDDNTLALEDTPPARNLALLPRSRMGVAMLLLSSTGENAADELLEKKQQQIKTWTTVALSVITDLMTKTSVPASQVLAPVTELLNTFRSRKCITLVENGETSLIELISRLYKMLPRADKIHPVWRNPRHGENPLHLKPPVNKDNIRRWRRIREIWCPLKDNATDAAQMQEFEKIAVAAVESYTSYVNMCVKHKAPVQYSFEHFLPYILYQMQDGLSVTLYTPNVGVTHTEVPTVCVVPKVDLMQFLPQTSMLPKYKSLKENKINVRILSRMQKVKTYLVHLYGGNL
jgi:hypothetical protein